MTETDAKPTLLFEIQNPQHALTEKEFVQMYKDEIVMLILQNKASIKSSSDIHYSSILEHSVIKSLPTLVSVDFKEDFGIIGIYE